MLEQALAGVSVAMDDQTRAQLDALVPSLKAARATHRPMADSGGNFWPITQRVIRPKRIRAKLVWPTFTAQVMPRNTWVPASDDRYCGGRR